MASAAPTLRDLHLGFVTPREGPVAPRSKTYAWIDEDPDLAKPARRETPLTAFA